MQNVEWVMGEWVIPLRLLRLLEHLAVLTRSMGVGFNYDFHTDYAEYIITVQKILHFIRNCSPLNSVELGL